ncbi:MAG: response regulator [Acidobacteria bacterium]|nr:response regulator [Acidobacteriota bacterium]
MKRKIRLILIAEDCKDIRDVYGEFLARRGFEVALANDGQEVVNKAVSIQPDVIIMDLVMPVMDGWEATLRLKADVRTKDIPVVILTANGFASTPLVIQQGCAGFLIKPCEPDAMVAEIARVLENMDRNVHLRSAA